MAVFSSRTILEFGGALVLAIALFFWILDAVWVSAHYFDVSNHCCKGVPERLALHYMTMIISSIFRLVAFPVVGFVALHWNNLYHGGHIQTAPAKEKKDL